MCIRDRPSFVLINREKLIDAGGYSQKWRFPIDLDSYVNLLNYGNGTLINSIVGEFMVSKFSWSSSMKRHQMTEMFLYFDYLFEFSKDYKSKKSLQFSKLLIVIRTCIRNIFIILLS